MMKIRLAISALALGLSAIPAWAGDNAGEPRVTTEAAVRMISNLTYTEILRQAWSKGWRFTPEQIDSGYRRHFEEFKLQLINRGFLVLSGEEGA